MNPHWRPALLSDLPRISTIANLVHLDLPERPEVLEEKIRLFPQGASVLAVGENIAGYGIAHPWKLRDLPRLNAFLGQLPADADCLYIHDVAILPEFRKKLAGRCYIDGVSELATRMNLNSLALVSVYDTSTLWMRLGFKITAPCAGMTDKLASYGEAARYMIRDLS